MRLSSKAAVCAALAAGLLAGCSGTNSGASSSLPGGSAIPSHRVHHNWAPINLLGSGYSNQSKSRGKDVRFNGRGVPPPAARGGFFASQFLGSGVPAWAQKPNPENDPPMCTVSTPQTDFVNGIGADQKGNLIVPGSSYTSGTDEAWTIQVFQGPNVCPGDLIGTIPVTTGQPVDAFAFDAATGPIAVSEINFDTGKGDVVICTLASDSCSGPITSTSVKSWGAGVVMDTAGDCWLSTATKSALNHPVGFQLIYWQGCTGNGQVATGTQNSTYGGLFLDSQGNLDAIDGFGEALYVYQGCNPVCTPVNDGGLPLRGQGLFGNLNGAGTRLAVGDTNNASVDVFVYTPTALTYRYNFNNGLTLGLDVSAGIFSPNNQRQRRGL